MARNSLQLSRRQWFAALAVIATPKSVSAAPSVHLNGILTPADSGNLEGYYALCGEGGVCNAVETLGISVHPKNPIFADDLKAMAGQWVQVSIFPTAK